MQYLGRLLSQDDDDVRPVRAQIREARATWARVSNVLWAQNATPPISAKFYNAVVQSLLLYGSKVGAQQDGVGQGWRGFTFGRRTTWQNNMCLGADLIGGGLTQSWRMF